MRRFSVKHKAGRSSHNNQWMNFRSILQRLLLWWGIGAGIGLLFALALDGDMKQVLAGHLEKSVNLLLGRSGPSFTYYLKRCLTYIQLLLVVWGLEMWNCGVFGVRILLLGRGFIYGFSQTAWACAYGMKGILLGTVAYIPHNLLFAAAIAWIEGWLHKNGHHNFVSIRLLVIWLALVVPIITWAEACWSPNIMKACM